MNVEYHLMVWFSFDTIAVYRPGVLFSLGGFVGAVWREEPPLRDSYRDSYRGSESPPAEVVLF